MFYYDSAGGWKTDFAAEIGEWISKESEETWRAWGERIKIGEAMFAVRQRYRGQSGVEQVFPVWVFSLLHASQHALVGASDTNGEENAGKPLNMNSTMTKSTKLTVFKYSDRMVILYRG